MKKSIFIVILLLLISTICFADISVRIVTRAETASQIRAKNLLLRNLFVFDDVYVVEEEEDFRVDLLVRDILTDEESVAGHTLAFYMFGRADWPTVGDKLLDEGKISEAERPAFDKLSTNTYFPLFFWSDYCTPEAMNISIEKVVNFINENFFASTRPKPIEEVGETSSSTEE